MVLLAITTETWIVTGLGFGIVLVLLFCLVFILQGFGALMQKILAPKTPKPEQPKEKQSVSTEEKKSREIVSEVVPTDEATLAVIAASLAEANDDEVAIAMALYLYKNTRHDIPTAVIKRQARNTAWNVKSYGLNNVGF